MPFVITELNALHPFREGNGRAQREFISHLAHANGYYIAWENADRAEMLQASIDSFRGDTSKLTAIIRENLQPIHRDVPERRSNPKPPVDPKQGPDR